MRPGFAFGAAHVEATPVRVMRPVCWPLVDAKPGPFGGAVPSVPEMEAPGTCPTCTVKRKIFGLEPPEKEREREKSITVPQGTDEETPTTNGDAAFVPLDEAAIVP